MVTIRCCYATPPYADDADAADDIDMRVLLIVVVFA